MIIVSSVTNEYEPFILVVLHCGKVNSFLDTIQSSMEIVKTLKSFLSSSEASNTGSGIRIRCFSLFDFREESYLTYLNEKNMEE